MKLTAFLLFIGMLQVSARTIAQQRISISLKRASLDKVFVEIEKRSGYTVFYNVEILKNSGLVTIDMKDATIDDVMHSCLKGLPLEFSIQDKTVFVKHETRKTAMEPAAGADNDPPAVTGTVKSEAGAPLAGATIFIPKLKKTGFTNENGEFLLKDVPNGAYKIEISFIGYEKYASTITVEDHKGKIAAVMKTASNVLDETVVIPYGTTTKRLNTGDVTTVTAKEIEEQPVSNPLAALEGRVPGLVITQTTGAPGGSFTMLLRGLNSIQNGNQPFFVIDGVPYDAQLPVLPSYASALLNSTLQGSNAASPGGNPLNYINPNDIESIEILKDADATAIYGSRAANGAILITTKKGKAGRMQIDLNVCSGLEDPATDIKLLNTTQYLAMRHQAFKNDSATPQPYDYDVNGVWDTTRYTNWSKTLTNNIAHYDNAQASVSGGNTNSQYLFGAGFNQQSTPFPTLHSGDGIDQKESVHFNLNTQSSDTRFKLAFTGSYVYNKNTVQSEDFSRDRLYLAPDAPALFNPDHSLNWASLVPGQAGTWANPYSNLNIKYRQGTSNLVGNAVLSYTILHNWDIKTSFGYNTRTINEIQAYPTTFFDPGLDIQSGNSSFNTITTNSWIIEPQSTYRLQIFRGILSVLGGTTFEENRSNNEQLGASNFISDALLENPSAAGNLSVNSRSIQYKYNAAFGRINYNWEDKYLLNLAARRDGSSRFGPGKQFGNFGSIGGAWIFSRENFIQDHLTFLTFGKIRGSYGTTGNDGIGDYQYYDLYNTTSLPYGGIPGLYPVNLSNPNLAWEKNKKLEGGLELGFLKDRITLQVSYYRNRSGNQLVYTPVSQVTGFGYLPANLPATVQNTGKEIILRTTNIKQKDFVWSSSVNLTIAKNKLISFPNLAASFYANSVKIGQPINTLFLYHCIGVNDTTGLYEFADSKGTPTYAPNYTTDRIATINTSPKFYGGFQNSFRYRNISIDFLFQFTKQIGRNIFGAYSAMPGVLANFPVGFLNHWQTPGDKSKYQQFSQNYSSAAANSFNIAQQSDFSYSDASFIRLKNVAISWQFPDRLRHRFGMENARVYLQGQNLLTITHYNGIDPESQGIGLPPMRVFSAGFEVAL